MTDLDGNDELKHLEPRLWDCPRAFEAASQILITPSYRRVRAHGRLQVFRGRNTVAG
jgi:hypothetical protein